MKKLLTIITLISLTFIDMPAFCQEENPAKEKSSVEKTAEDIGNLFKKKKQPTEAVKDKQEEEALKMWKDMATRGGDSQDLLDNIRDDYSFDTRLHYEIVSKETKGDKEHHADVVYHISDKERYMALEPLVGDSESTEGMEVMSVFDTENKVMLNFTKDNKGERQAIAMSLDPDHHTMDEESRRVMEEYTMQDEDNESEVTELEFKKTGRVKQINGLNSEEYQAEDKDSKINIWLAKVDFSTTMMPGGFRQSPELADMLGDIPVGENMLMTEMTALDKKENETTTITLKGLGKSDVKINTHDYSIYPIAQPMGMPTPDKE
ncbi:hypothetical protein V6R21_14025 [Limibacter armeniacum]|uniref:hypothetical protein n=1 Tax=Limibacter armeniacum TaxID=466084 RepID=UPI002FE6136C